MSRSVLGRQTDSLRASVAREELGRAEEISKVSVCCRALLREVLRCSRDGYYLDIISD